MALVDGVIDQQPKRVRAEFRSILVGLDQLGSLRFLSATVRDLALTGGIFSSLLMVRTRILGRARSTPFSRSA